MTTSTVVACLLILLPAAGAFLAAGVSWQTTSTGAPEQSPTSAQKAREQAANRAAFLSSVIATGLAAACAVALAAIHDRAQGNADVASHVLATIPTGAQPIHLSLLPDSYAATLALLVTGVALLVQLYARAYLPLHAREHGWPVRYRSFAAIVGLFTSAMLLLVLAGDVIVLFVGWEVMGLCSYLLIGYDWQHQPARAAALKAFLVTRVGDVALLVGLIMLGAQAGGFDLPTISQTLRSPAGHTVVVTVAGLLVLLGIAGKSAQVPLHLWLPDAMAGPTPVSALIHAATMVAAGVFLGVRLQMVFSASGVVMVTAAVIAALTMLGAALAALVQTDLKRVLAYSTISQLGFMLGAVAVEAPQAALYHLTSHGAFKALLFLTAGAVILAAGTGQVGLIAARLRLHRQAVGDQSHTTAWLQKLSTGRGFFVVPVAWVVGLASLAGVPPLAGFFSKDGVLEAALEAWNGRPSLASAGAQGSQVDSLAVAGQVVLVAGLATVIVTAAYVTRVGLLVLAGPRPAAQREAGEDQLSVQEVEQGESEHLTDLSAATSSPVTGQEPTLQASTDTPSLPIPSVGARALGPGQLPALMATALVVLLVPTALLGLAMVGVEALHTSPAHMAMIGAITLALGAAGALAVWVRWRTTGLACSDQSLTHRRLTTWVRSGFGLDAVVEMVVLAPARALAAAIDRTERAGTDRAGSGVAALVGRLGSWTQRAHSGNAQLSLSLLAAAALALAVWAVIP